MYDTPKVYFYSRLQLGDNIHINDQVFIHAAGGVKIGKNGVLSHGVSLLSTGLDISCWKDRNVYEDIHKDLPIIIGDNVWLGTNVTVCPGVSIASNCVVAAGAVVAKDLNEENCLYGGIPAKKIREL